MQTPCEFKLMPRGGPSRRVAKARRYQPEITRLYSEGYTCKAILEALADVGVQVSESTLRRELKRRPLPRLTDSLHAQNAANTPRLKSGSSMAVSDQRSGKDIAESFIRGRITNTLFRARGSA